MRKKAKVVTLQSEILENAIKRCKRKANDPQLSLREQRKYLSKMNHYIKMRGSENIKQMDAKLMNKDKL